MANTNDLLRKRFAEACAERDAILAKSAPLRQQREDILAKARKIEQTADAVMEKIKGVESPLYELHNEIARISRALNGQTAQQ